MIRQWPSCIQHRHTAMFMLPGRLPAGSALTHDAIAARPIRKEARYDR